MINRISDKRQREDDNKRHEDFITLFRGKNQILKDDIKNKLSSSIK